MFVWNVESWQLRNYADLRLFYRKAIWSAVPGLFGSGGAEEAKARRVPKKELHEAFIKESLAPQRTLHPPER
jgi:hypothetical protein